MCGWVMLYAPKKAEQAQNHENKELRGEYRIVTPILSQQLGLQI